MFGGRKNTKVKHESKGRQSEFDFLKRMRGKAEEEALMQEEKNILVKEQNEQAQPQVRDMIKKTMGKIIKERGQKQPLQKLNKKFTKRKTDEPVKYKGAGGPDNEKDTRESELDFLKRVRGTAEEKELEQEERAILQKEAQIQDYPQLKKSVFKSLKGTIDQRGQRKPWQKLYEGIEPEPKEDFKHREVLAPIAYDAPDKKENDAIKAEMNAIKNKVNEEKLNDIANAVKAIEKSTGERVTQDELKKIAKETEKNYKQVNKEIDEYLKEYKDYSEKLTNKEIDKYLKDFKKYDTKRQTKEATKQREIDAEKAIEDYYKQESELKQRVENQKLPTVRKYNKEDAKKRADESEKAIEDYYKRDAKRQLEKQLLQKEKEEYDYWNQYEDDARFKEPEGQTQEEMRYEQNKKMRDELKKKHQKEFQDETTKRRIDVMKGHSKGQGYLIAGAFGGPSGIKNRFNVNKMTDDEFEAYNIMMSKAPKGKNAYGYPDTDVGIGAGMNKKLINRPVDTVMIDKMKKQALKEIKPLVKGVANYKSRGEDYLAELDQATLKSNLPYNSVEQEIDRQKAYKKAIEMTRKRLL